MAKNYMSMGAINCSTEGATHPVPSTRSKFWPSRITIQFCNQVILSVLSVSGLGIAQSQCGRDSGSLRIAMPSLRPCIFVLTSQHALNISGKKAAWSGTIFFCHPTDYELLRWLVETPSRDFEHYRMTDDSRRSIVRHSYVKCQKTMQIKFSGIIFITTTVQRSDGSPWPWRKSPSPCLCCFQVLALGLVNCCICSAFRQGHSPPSCSAHLCLPIIRLSWATIMKSSHIAWLS